MKRKAGMIVLLSLVMMVILYAFAVNNDEVLLTELTDEECIAFLKDYGVEIPTIYENEIDCVPFVRVEIERAQTNSVEDVVYWDPRLYGFANDIQRAVREFYGAANARKYTKCYDSSLVEDSTKHGE